MLLKTCKKSRIWETPKLLTDADSSKASFFPAGVAAAAAAKGLFIKKNRKNK